MLLKRQYRILTGNFATDFQYLTTQMENLLYEHPQDATALNRDLGYSVTTNRSRIMDVQMDELKARSSDKMLWKKSRKLIKERNSLPWGKI